MTIAKYLVTSESFCNHTLIKTTILEAKYTVWKKEFSQEPMQSRETVSTALLLPQELRRVVAARFC